MTTKNRFFICFGFVSPSYDLCVFAMFYYSFVICIHNVCLPTDITCSVEDLYSFIPFLKGFLFYISEKYSIIAAIINHDEIGPVSSYLLTGAFPRNFLL